MERPELIYCGGNNARYAAIAIAAGYRYGCELTGDTPYAPVYFADQDWTAHKRAVAKGRGDAFRAKYMARLAQHRPAMATVLDLERAEQVGEVLSWAEEAAQYVGRVLIIPKYTCATDALPRRIGGADVILAYSVPTRYGGTEVPVWEFQGWPVHLLGGSPHAQMRLWRYMDVVSVDGNMHQERSNRCQFWSAQKGPKGHWWQLSEAGDTDRAKGARDRAFRRSCENIMAAWGAL